MKDTKVLGVGVNVSNADVGLDPYLVDVQSTEVFTEDFEHGVSPARDCRGVRDWLSGKNRVNFGRDKFTGYGFEPIIDAFTDSRLHTMMQDLPLFSPPLCSLGSIVHRPCKTSILHTK